MKSNEKKKTKVSTRSREATCQKLMDAGLKVFCKHGYDAATTKLVAKESGVNESLINRYFQSKEGLLNTIIETLAKDLTLKMVAYPQGETLEQEIYNHLTSRFVAMVENQKFIKIAISRSLIENEAKSKLNKALKATTHEGAPQILVDRLTEFQKKGLIRSDVNIYRTAVSISLLGLSTFVFAHLQMDISREIVLKIYQDFSRDYAKGMGPLPS
jgi:AcrR family transcriptional regulator